jgi:formylglycine-generating enzyme required for sulfatase activity/energy-coupling factor transporter ATP-binding protein EcfA2
MEYWTGSEKPVKEKCLAHVAEAKVFLGIITWQYGWVPPGEEKSITELEYEEAGRRRIPRLMFLLDNERPGPGFEMENDPQSLVKLLAFRKRIQEGPETARPFSESDYIELVMQALFEWKARRQGTGKKGTALAETDSYLKYVVEQNSHIRLAGFRTNLRMPLSFEDLWVPLTLQRQLNFEEPERAMRLEKHGRGGLATGEESEVTLADRLQRIFRPRAGRKALVLLGHPGAGKTTQLRHVALLLARQGSTALGLEAGVLPLLLPLRFLEAADECLEGFAQRLLSDRNLRLPADTADRLFSQRLLLLLDGIDEVPEAKRPLVRRWIETTIQGPQGHRALVSCRFLGYRDEARLDPTLSEVLEVRPLTSQQCEALIDNWYRAVELAEAEGNTSGSAGMARAEAKAISEASDLKQRLSETTSPQLIALTANPLLLTSMCLVHRDRGQRLPERRVELYTECIDGLLELWRERQQRQYPIQGLPPVSFPAAQAREVLAPMALWLHEQGLTAATSADLAPLLRDAFAVAKLPASLTPESFLNTIRDESGLVTGFSHTQYGFLHLRFQEYLAAHRLRSRLLELATATPPAEFQKLVQQQLVSRFPQDRWAEVFHCLFADASSRPLFAPFFSALLRDPIALTAENRLRQLLRDIPYFLPEPFQELLSDKSVRSTAFRSLAADILRTHAPDRLPAEARTPEQEPRSSTQPTIETIQALGLRFAKIPAGKFNMGSPKDEAGRWDGEWLPHKVLVPEFSLAVTPITNAQYRIYLAEAPKAKRPEYWGDERFNQADQPVVGINRDEAVAYCDWLTAKLGDGSQVRLPSEAEWEYACRAGTDTRFWSGSKEEDLAQVGWYSENSGDALHAVAEKPANAWGLFDMHGNVWEWCSDWWCHAESKHADKVKSLHPAPCSEAHQSDPHRVVRGGCFAAGARNARSTYRNGPHPGYRGTNLGFRPVRVTP